MKEYYFKEKDIDLGIATITGRYPSQGYGVNFSNKMLIYVIEGNGKIGFEDSNIAFNEGDSILIDKNEKYFWETKRCVVSISCTPAWNFS